MTKIRKPFSMRSRSRWPCGLRCWSAAARWLVLRVGIPLRARMFVCFVCCVLCTWSYNKVRELIKVKVLHTSLLNTTMFAFKVLPLGSYTPIPAPSPLFKTILDPVLWNSLQSCRSITPDVIRVIKMPTFQYFLYLREHKKGNGG